MSRRSQLRVGIALVIAMGCGATNAAAQSERYPKMVENGAVDYMMSKSAYLTDQGEHNMPHVMFLTAGMEPKDWGANVAGSPIISVPYWFFSSPETSQTKGLPPILVSLIGVANWSDGTPAATHGA